jgi:tetratricopeptide (TPR) repeat protein
MQQAVQVAPSDGYAQRNLGGVLMSLGRAQEALPHLRKAREVLPHDLQTTFGLASALIKVGNPDDEAEADELFTVVIERWPGSKPAELARQARTKIAHTNLRGAVSGGLRPDVVMYIQNALDTFEKVGPAKSRDIAFEIALKGQSGLDINDSEQKYTLNTLPGKFSGIHLLAIMYSGFQQMDPTLDAGVDFKAEYAAAQAMRRTS